MARGISNVEGEPRGGWFRTGPPATTTHHRTPPHAIITHHQYVVWPHWNTTFHKAETSGLARCAQFLIHVPVTSADVERSFSLAGYMDSKYRRSLPNNTRRTTLMLMCNGDIEGRF